MTAAELNEFAAEKAAETALYNGLTEQVRLTSLTHGWRTEWTGNIQVHHPVKDPPDRTGPEYYDEHDERL